MFNVGDLVYFDPVQLAKRHVRFREEVKRGKHAGYIVLNDKSTNEVRLAKVMWDEGKDFVRCVILGRSYWIDYKHVINARKNELLLTEYRIDNGKQAARETYIKHVEFIESTKQKAQERAEQRELARKEKLRSMTYEERQKFFEEEKAKRIAHKEKMKKAKAARRKFKKSNHGVQSCTNYDRSKIYGPIKIVRG